MIESYDIACHGLAIGWPIDELAAWLNAHTPVGLHFNVVGGLDPRPETNNIINGTIVKARAGIAPIYIGHSLGAMLAYYTADALKKSGLKSPLFVSIDPTCWGTNAPGIPLWDVLVFPPNTGRYFVPDNVDVWLNFYQDGPPGGGVGVLAPGNTHTDFQNVHLPSENHLSIVNATLVREAILKAVLAVAEAS